MQWPATHHHRKRMVLVCFCFCVFLFCVVCTVHVFFVCVYVCLYMWVYICMRVCVCVFSPFCVFLISPCANTKHSAKSDSIAMTSVTPIKKGSWVKKLDEETNAY